MDLAVHPPLERAGRCSTKSRVPNIDIFCGVGVAVSLGGDAFEPGGAVCPVVDYDFIYPFGSDGYYKLDLWIDGYIDNDISICIQAECGGTPATAGFSDDGVTPYPCANTIVFPAYRSIIANDIIIPGNSVPLAGWLPIILGLILTLIIPFRSGMVRINPSMMGSHPAKGTEFPGIMISFAIMDR